MKILKAVVILSILWHALPSQAETYLTIKCPITVTDSKAKIAYAYKAQEDLRILHNQKSTEYRDGKLSKTEWMTWEKDFFEPRSNAICVEIIKQKNLLKKEAIYSIDMEKDFEQNTI